MTRSLFEGVCGRWIAAALLLAAAAPAWAGFERINTTNPDDPMAVAIYRLDNGLTVYLTSYHEEPRFYAEIAVRAGSKQDPAETTGLAHYLEHLLFKGTQAMGTQDYAGERPHLDRIRDLYEEHFHATDPAERDRIWGEIVKESEAAAEHAIPNELDRLYGAMGASDVNAHTWHEETVYKVSLPSNRIEQWAVIESERFAQPVMRLFQTELETVYEEMNRALDSKMYLITRAVDETLYKKHPYGQQSTLGKVEHLKNPSIKNIETYYNMWYVPNNMGIFISGDIEPESTMAIIDHYFSRWTPKKLPKPRKWREKPLEGREYVETQYEGEEYVLLAYRTAPQHHKDAEALLLLDMVLDNATAGLINLNLNQRQAVRAAGSFPQQYNDYGAQYFWGVPKEGQTLEDVEALLREQVELVKRGEFEDWILPAIILDFKKNRKAGFEQNTSRVGMMRDAFIAFEDWDDAVAQIARMEKLTKADVVRVAKKYFRDDYVAGFRKDAPHTVPDIAKPALASITIDPSRVSDFARRVLAMDAAPIAPEFIEPGVDYTVTRDPNGVDFYHAPNPVNDLFNFSIVIEFGNHEDNTIGIATRLLDKAGTAQFSPEALKKEWYRLGTEFGIGAGDNQTTITLRGLDENFEASLALMLEYLARPVVEPGALDELKGIILQERADAKKQQDSIQGALVQYNRYQDQSVYLRMLPDAAVAQLEAAPLLKVIQNLLGYRHAITYCGSLPQERVAALLAEHHPVTEPLKEPPAYRYLKARIPEQTEIYFHHKETAKAEVRIEFGTVDFDEQLTPKVQMFNEYFAGGMAGIVFQELREARGLAYMAAARYLQGYRKGDQDLMIGVVQTQADKAPEALRTFLDLFEQLPVSEERFAVAKDALISQYRTERVGFRDVIGAVRTWERHGLEPDPRKARFAAIESGTLEDVTGFHAAQVAGTPKLISIVGDRSKIGMDRLEAIAPVKEVPLEAIFVE